MKINQETRLNRILKNSMILILVTLIQTSLSILSCLGKKFIAPESKSRFGTPQNSQQSNPFYRILNFLMSALTRLIVRLGSKKFLKDMAGSSPDRIQNFIKKNRPKSPWNRASVGSPFFLIYPVRDVAGSCFGQFFYFHNHSCRTVLA